MECFGCDKSVCSTRVAGHYGKVWVVHLLSEASTWLARTSSVRSHPSPSQWTSSLCVRFVCFCLPGFLGLSIFFCPHSICCAEKQCNITWHKETLWREKLFADPMFQSAYKLVILLFLLTFAAVFVCFVCVSVSLWVFCLIKLKDALWCPMAVTTIYFFWSVHLDGHVKWYVNVLVSCTIPLIGTSIFTQTHTTCGSQNWLFAYSSFFFFLFCFVISTA